MLSDLIPQKNLRKRRRKLTERARWWSDAQKLEAVKLWLVTGNLTQTAAALNIPWNTIKEWRYSKWWGDLAAEIKAEGRVVLSNKLKTIAAKALEITADRLENGDVVMNQKTGELVRRPVPMREAYNVAVGLMDRQLKLEDKPAEDENQATVNDKLAQLADAFSKFANKAKKIEVIDVEYKDGLQETQTQT